ncbi:MAG: hypothetical protein ACOYYS_02040 [Chloroflexota bacterium]
MARFSLIGLLVVDGALAKMLFTLQTTAGVPEADGLWMGAGLALMAVGLLGSKLPWRNCRAGPPAMFVPSAASGIVKRITYALAYVTILFAVMIAFRSIYRLDSTRVWRDTLTYTDAASLPLASDEFWFGLRAPTLPLIYKVFGLTSDVVDTPAFDIRSKRLILFQGAFSVLAFSLLGLVIGTLFIKTRWLKPATLGLFLAFGLNIAVSQWNKLLLSESLSTSLFVILMALVLLGVYGWAHWEQAAAPWWIVYLLVLAVTTFFYALTRDTNMYFLLMAVALLAAGLLFKSIQRHPGLHAYMALIVVTGCIVVFQYVSFHRGLRWLYPFVNLFYERILPVPDARAYFVKQGLPMADELDDLQAVERRQLHIVLAQDEHYRPIYDWMVAHGSSAYARYLLLKPLNSMLLPFQDFRSLVSPDSSEYRIRMLDDPAWVTGLRHVLYPSNVFLLFAWLSGLVVSAVWQYKRCIGLPWQVVPVALLLTLYPLMFVIWHGDSIELERHAYQIDFQIRLALWLATVFVFEGFLQYCAAQLDRKRTT